MRSFAVALFCLVLASHARRAHKVNSEDVDQSGINAKAYAESNAEVGARQLATLLMANNAAAGHARSFPKGFSHALKSKHGGASLLSLRGGGATANFPYSFSSLKSQAQSIDAEDIEKATKAAWYTLKGLGQNIKAFCKKYSRYVTAIAGVLGLAHGGCVAFTVLFIRSFTKTGLPTVKNALAKGYDAYKSAKEELSEEATTKISALQTELDALATKHAALNAANATDAELFAVQDKMNSIRAQIKAVAPHEGTSPLVATLLEPDVVKDVVLGVWSGITASVVAACSAGARTIGVGSSLGDCVSKTMAWLIVKGGVLFKRVSSSLPPETAKILAAGPSVFGAATLKLVGRGVGVFAAWKLQSLAETLTVSLLSAHMLIEAIDPSASEVWELAADKISLVDMDDVEAARKWWKDQGIEAAAWSLAIGSVLLQASSDNKLPLFLKVPLLPALGVEAALEKIAKEMTKNDWTTFLPTSR